MVLLNVQKKALHICIFIYLSHEIIPVVAHTAQFDLETFQEATKQQHTSPFFN